MKHQIAPVASSEFALNEAPPCPSNHPAEWGNELKYAPGPSLTGMHGGQIVCEMLRRHHVRFIFGISGGAIMPVFDALHNNSHFEIVLPRHEQRASHMAQGYARISKKVGVLLVTSGPGATNLVTPLQDAL
ncbi:Thiamine pyrophosphate enzyme C-terminal TPP-binding [Penicillium malachiteum]|uniref:Thiamine pyrophosphate enzyme C-terminal TPP-binding n=1 Tax=Penicillium malachiteum TaxID=1324776 RepID=UPI0025465E6B|nr:Thiamine pyrophosphate enzyme C-terminal TPP-binding [Penicillium malachiteum]KAJ5714881.1 Thiamine pyrophosphate enzyme C-terminal TPP-binding [Penicillium malachiteum]